MQQTNATQFSPVSADWLQAQQAAAPQAYAMPQTQSYAQPQAQTYAQPQAQSYAQSQAQSYAQPYAQPYGQPYAQPQAQSFAQPQPQPYAAPQTQSPGVAPVSAPVAPGGASSASSQPTPQQQFAKHLTSLARTLEQLIPGNQIMISILLDVSVSPKAESMTTLVPLLENLRQTSLIHYGALGAIRRFLLGEATPDVLTSLAGCVTRLINLQSRTRGLWDQTLSAAPAEVRSVLANLNQVVTGADQLLSQAASGVQTAVGPQVWAAVQAQAAGTKAE